MFHSVKSILSSSTPFIFLSCLFSLSFATMATVNNYPDAPEAQVIALESSGELLAPEALVARIEKDLAAIRAHTPAVAEVHHTQKWQPGKLMIHDVTPESLERINKSPYGPVESKAIFQDKIFLVTFKKPYNPEKLAEVLKRDFGIENARPDGIIGGSSSITLTSDPSGKNTYVIMKGWGDCFSGCINKHFWTFTVGVDQSSVTLDSESGDDPNDASGAGGSDRPVGMGGGMGLF
jgi:hypothetical protein